MWRKYGSYECGGGSKNSSVGLGRMEIREEELTSGLTRKLTHTLSTSAESTLQ